MKKERKNEQFWSQYSENFHNLSFYVVGRENMYIFLSRVNKLRNLGDTLEIACGNGTYTELIAQNATSVLATDISKEMVEVTKGRLKDIENVEVREESAFNLKVQDNSFDTVFLANFLHVTTDCNGLLKEIYRVLKPGGKIIAFDITMYSMSFINRLTLAYRFTKTYKFPKEKAEHGSLSPLIVEELFKKNSFEVEKIEVMGEKVKAILSIGKKIV